MAALPALAPVAALASGTRACPSQVSVPLPKGRVSHDVKCEIMPTRFSLAIRGEKPEPYLSGTLFRPINVDESHWQLWPVGARTRLAARAAVLPRAHSLSRLGAAEGEPRSIKVSMAKAKPSRWPTLFAAGAASVVETQEKKKDR